MKASTIAEIFVEETNIQVKIEVGTDDSTTFCIVVEAEQTSLVTESAIALRYECAASIEEKQISPAIRVIKVEVAIILEVNEAGAPAPGAVADTGPFSG